MLEQFAAVWPQTSHLTSLSLCLTEERRRLNWIMYVGLSLHQAKSCRMCCLCANEGRMPEPALWGPFVSSGPVYKHCIFLRKNKELLPRPSITGKTGPRCTMHTHCSQGAGHRGHLASGPLLLGPELSGAWVPGNTRAYIHAHTGRMQCAHLHTRTPAWRQTCTHVRAPTSTHNGNAVCRPVHMFTCTHVCQHRDKHVHAPTHVHPRAHRNPSGAVAPLLLRPEPRVSGSGEFTGKAERAEHEQETGRRLSLPLLDPERPGTAEALPPVPVLEPTRARHGCHRARTTARLMSGAVAHPPQS